MRRLWLCLYYSVLATLVIVLGAVVRLGWIEIFIVVLAWFGGVVTVLLALDFQKGKAR